MAIPGFFKITRYSTKMDARVAAAICLDQILGEGRSMDTALTNILEDISDARDRAYTQELCFGVLRSYERQQYYIDHLLKKPFRSQDRILNSVLHCGIYQLDKMRTPDHAAVSATVGSVESFDKSWARGLVNAILRRYQREKDQLDSTKDPGEEFIYSHPQWFIDRLKVDWPDNWKDILLANNSHPPMTLRLNTRKMSRDTFLNQLQDSGLNGKIHAIAACGLSLDTPVDVGRIPGFETGYASVQDAGAQLVVPLLELASGMRVLDACAAPGGKTGHIMEAEPEIGELIALEYNVNRIQQLENNRQRLGLNFKIVQGSACEVGSWWDGEAFDRILVDVPCSASGVIRRHPDIKYLRNPADIAVLSDTQHDMLMSVWPLLKHRGKLIYVTCSVFNDENDKQIEKFISNRSDVSVIRIQEDWGVLCKYGRQVLPGQHGMDGFYYSVLEKKL